MTSVAASHTSTRSKKSAKHGKTRSEGRPFTPDPVEKLAVRTAGLKLGPGPKSSQSEVPGETLSMMLGDRTRRSRCTPEFLLEMSAREPSEFFEEFGKKLKILTGPEAATFYEKFLGGMSTEEILGMNERAASADTNPYVVFAVPVIDTGRRRADYYTTWPRTESAHDPTEARRLKHLHSQFRKTARVLDSEFKRASIYGTAASILSEKSIEEPEEPLTTKAPPPVLAPPPDLEVDENVPAPPVSATDSVMSLPYLDFIRNVPNAHRIPLRITNPDARLSMMSSLSPASPTTPTQASKTAQQPALASIKEVEPTYIPTPTPFSTPASLEKLLGPETVRRSSSSIRSKGSNKSSAASTTTVESHRGKHRHKEIAEFLVVLLEERTDPVKRTWHGLERQVSRSTPKSSSRVSLWDGPLARETGRSFVHQPRPDGEESSEEEEEWDNTPVIPRPPPFFRIARSVSEPQHLPPMMHPVLQQYRMPASLGGSPIGSFANLGYGPSPMPAPAPVLYSHSPYPQTYASLYHSPVVPAIRPLSRTMYPPPFQP